MSGHSLNDLFPGYTIPAEEEMRDFLQRGLIALDTNALFDLYRFNKTARSEYLHALQALEDRLWIPHRVAEEFVKGRIGVIDECSSATGTLSTELNDLLSGINKKLQEFANRRGLTQQEVLPLKEIADQAIARINTRLTDLFSFELSLDAAIKDDSILAMIESLINGKIGPALENEDESRAEGKRRLDREIPPGYKDGKKEPELAIGDYFVWAQLLLEAKDRATPVLLVSNDQKEDWIREEKGRKLGPRLELVREMKDVAGTPFYMLTVRSFLIQAQKHLGVIVSDATVAQAEQLDEIRENEQQAERVRDTEAIQGERLRAKILADIANVRTQGVTPTFAWIFNRNRDDPSFSGEGLVRAISRLRDDGLITWEDAKRRPVPAAKSRIYLTKKYRKGYLADQNFVDSFSEASEREPDPETQFFYPDDDLNF
jgi:hypothetical protein